jgi:hypothetical protein
MKIWKTLCAVEGLAGIPKPYDTIEYEGKKWIVPRWLAQHALGCETPERIIQLDNLQYHEVDGLFVLDGRLPKSVFEGNDPSQIEAPYIVQFLPDVSIQLRQQN